jgi:CRISPR-associated protein Cas6/Cse3/CasE subtype I-E
VADLFGDRTDRGYLYRVTGEWPGGADVLILSSARPLPVDRVSSPAHRRAERVESKPFTPELVSGQLLDYEIRINATQVVTMPDTARKQRTDAWEAVWQADRNTVRTPHEVYGQYLTRKLEGVAEVLDARVTERGEVQAGRGDRRDTARYVATNLIGSLRVVEPERILEVVGHGIGRAKAFGCGLLCLSRPGTMLPRRYAADAGAL